MKPTYRKSLAGNLLLLLDLTFGPLLLGHMRIAKLKSAYNLLLILEVCNMLLDLTFGPY